MSPNRATRPGWRSALFTLARLPPFFPLQVVSVVALLLPTLARLPGQALRPGRSPCPGCSSTVPLRVWIIVAVKQAHLAPTMKAASSTLKVKS